MFGGSTGGDGGQSDLIDTDDIGTLRRVGVLGGGETGDGVRV